jgi:hypothetical protein
MNPPSVAGSLICPLQFDHEFVYRDASGILVPAVLKVGSRIVGFDAAVDTGATHCLFERIHAENLGLIVEPGYRRTFSTANSRFEAYGHELWINVLGLEFEAMVYFFADPQIRKNVLGRRGWLERIRLGVVDYDRTLYLSSYNFV